MTPQGVLIFLAYVAILTTERVFKDPRFHGMFFDEIWLPMFLFNLGWIIFGLGVVGWLPRFLAAWTAGIIATCVLAREMILDRSFMGAILVAMSLGLIALCARTIKKENARELR